MGSFAKYILVNLILFSALGVGAYRISKPAIGTNALPETMREQFLIDINSVKNLYGQFTEAVQTNDVSQLVSTKTNLEQGLAQLDRTYSAQGDFGRIVRKFTHNYERLIVLNETASGNQQSISARKDSLTNKIQKAETETQSLEMVLKML